MGVITEDAQYTCVDDSLKASLALELFTNCLRNAVLTCRMGLKSKTKLHTTAVEAICISMS